MMVEVVVDVAEDVTTMVSNGEVGIIMGIGIEATIVVDDVVLVVIDTTTGEGIGLEAEAEIVLMTGEDIVVEADRTITEEDIVAEADQTTTEEDTAVEADRMTDIVTEIVTEIEIEIVIQTATEIVHRQVRCGVIYIVVLKMKKMEMAECLHTPVSWSNALTKINWIRCSTVPFFVNFVKHLKMLIEIEIGYSNHKMQNLLCQNLENVQQNVKSVVLCVTNP